MTSGVGTTRWSAPEILKNKQNAGGHYTTKADVYSFGVVIWECIAKKIPWYDVPFDFMIEDKISKGDTLAIPENCHPVLRSLMDECWKFDPEERPSFLQILKIFEKEKFGGSFVIEFK